MTPPQVPAELLTDENLSALGCWLAYTPEARTLRYEAYKDLTPDVHVLLDFVNEHCPQYLRYIDCLRRLKHPDVLAWSM